MNTVGYNRAYTQKEKKNLVILGRFYVLNSVEIEQFYFFFFFTNFSILLPGYR